ncbi:hypothetical protein EH223_00775 [candidate division KSB1 bacterium]|nr:hypothetical protein [candidate division KSB1 bacterium]RQW07185.1 MAG: hypothetical protein EH223_00775 [candidate division KSB1 bacterium]
MGVINTKTITYFGLSLLIFGTALTCTVFVPSSHWVYDFIDRMEAKRFLPIVLAGTKPMTRAEIADFLTKVKTHQEQLSKVERDQLDFLLFEFHEHTSHTSSHKTRVQKIKESKWIKTWWPHFLYPQGRHLLEIDSGPVKINIDPIFYRGRMFADDDTLDERERVNTDTNGFLVWGTVGTHFGYYTDIRDTREWGTRDYPVGNTTGEGLGFVQGNGQQIYHDETVAYVLFSHKYLNVQFGKDSNVWGPGYRGQLFMSDYPTSYDQFKLQIVLKRLKFTYLLGWLKHYTPKYFKGDPTTKILAAHRLEFAPFRVIDIGLHSAVIYASRSFEPAYLNPVMFFRSAEHYLGDQDNAAMGVDLEIKAIKNTKLYGELFLDDLTTSRLGSGFYGNKYGVTAGLYYVDVLGLANLDFRIEYTALRPYTYAHKDTATAYAHFITPLGHPIGPNAVNLYAQLQYRLSRRLLFNLNYEMTNFGENTDDWNVGRDIFRPRNGFTDSETVRLLDGIRHDIRSLGLRGEYEFIRNGFFELAINLLNTDISQQSDWNYPVVRSQVEFGFRFNY